MRIGELAKATGVTTRALRFYEEQGLLTATRSHNGYRQYDESAIVLDERIEALTRAREQLASRSAASRDGAGCE